MFSEVKPQNLPDYLHSIDSFFPNFDPGSDLKQKDIDVYYKESFWGYKLFHSWAGAIHMALSPSGEFSKNDYFGQAIFVEKIIIESQLSAGNILEVGCGAGFNLRYLSKRLAEAKVHGIDISDTNVTEAKKLCHQIDNCAADLADFHDLSRFSDNQFDLVFAVETLCHAIDPTRAFSEIARVLKPGGQLIVFDGYRNGFNELDDQWKKAITYTERAMAVPKFLTFDEFKEITQSSQLVEIASTDLSKEIMPNLIRLSDRAKAFFRLQPIAKLMRATLPKGLVTNAIAGLLMSVTVSTGAHKYIVSRHSKV